MTNYLSVVLLFILFILCFAVFHSVIPPCPRIFALCNIFFFTKKGKTGICWIFILSPNSTKCMPCSHTCLVPAHAHEKFCSHFFFSLVTLINCTIQETFASFLIFRLYLSVYWRQKCVAVCLLSLHLPLLAFFTSLFVSLSLSLLLSFASVCLLCSVPQRTGRCFCCFKVRLLYWSTKSKCVFPFVWHEHHTSPDKHPMHSPTDIDTNHQRQDTHTVFIAELGCECAAHLKRFGLWLLVPLWDPFLKLSKYPDSLSWDLPDIKVAGLSFLASIHCHLSCSCIHSVIN